MSVSAFNEFLLRWMPLIGDAAACAAVVFAVLALVNLGRLIEREQINRERRK